MILFCFLLLVVWFASVVFCKIQVHANPATSGNSNNQASTTTTTTTKASADDGSLSFQRKILESELRRRKDEQLRRRDTTATTATATTTTSSSSSNTTNNANNNNNTSTTKIETSPTIKRPNLAAVDVRSKKVNVARTLEQHVERVQASQKILDEVSSKINRLESNVLFLFCSIFVTNTLASMHTSLRATS